MGNGSLIEIILLAAVAGFLVLRLRSILGRRTGHQEPHRPRETNQDAHQPDMASDSDNVISLPGRRGDEPTTQQTIDAALLQIRRSDPGFNNRDFLNGAKAAFGMIVEGFAKGDTASIRPLLGDDLYDEFSNAIRDRIEEGDTLETEIEDIVDAQIVDAEMEGRKAIVTVRFTSKQRNATRNAEGDIVDGNSEVAETVTDLWTFARNTRSKDPTWALVRTEVPGEGDDDDDQERENG